MPRLPPGPSPAQPSPAAAPRPAGRWSQTGSRHAPRAAPAAQREGGAKSKCKVSKDVACNATSAVHPSTSCRPHLEGGAADDAIGGDAAAVQGEEGRGAAAQLLQAAGQGRTGQVRVPDCVTAPRCHHKVQAGTTATHAPHTRHERQPQPLRSPATGTPCTPPRPAASQTPASGPACCTARRRGGPAGANEWAGRVERWSRHDRMPTIRKHPQLKPLALCGPALRQRPLALCTGRARLTAKPRQPRGQSVADMPSPSAASIRQGRAGQA